VYLSFDRPLHTAKDDPGGILRKGFPSKPVVQKKFYSPVSSRSTSYLYLQVISKPLLFSLSPEVWLKEAFKIQRLHSSRSHVPQPWKIPSGYHQVDLPSSSGPCRIYILEKTTFLHPSALPISLTVQNSIEFLHKVLER